MRKTYLGKAAGRGEAAARRIIDLRARARTVAVDPSGNEHFAILQQRGRMIVERLDKAAGHRPSSTGWIVEFRPSNSASVAVTHP